MKIQKMISMEEDMYKILQNEANASALVENLLRDYYNRPKIKEDTSSKDLAEREERLKEEIKKIEELKKTKGEEEERGILLNNLGITNRFLIEKLKAMEEPPNIWAIKVLKDSYGKDIQSDNIIAAWRLLHGISK